MKKLLVIKMTHECIHEEQIQGISRTTAELEAKNGFKDQRINELIKDQKRMEDKIDKLGENVNELLLKSVQDDNNLNQRVTALETSQETTYKLLLLGFSALALLEFLLKYVI